MDILLKKEEMIELIYKMVSHYPGEIMILFEPVRIFGPGKDISEISAFLPEFIIKPNGDTRFYGNYGFLKLKQIYYQVYKFANGIGTLCYNGSGVQIIDESGKASIEYYYERILL